MIQTESRSGQSQTKSGSGQSQTGSRSEQLRNLTQIRSISNRIQICSISKRIQLRSTSNWNQIRLISNWIQIRSISNRIRIYKIGNHIGIGAHWTPSIQRYKWKCFKMVLHAASKIYYVKHKARLIHITLISMSKKKVNCQFYWVKIMKDRESGFFKGLIQIRFFSRWSESDPGFFRLVGCGSDFFVGRIRNKCKKYR